MKGDFAVDLSSLNLLSEVALVVQSEVNKPMSLPRFDEPIKKRASSPAMTKFNPHHRIDDFGSDRYSWGVLVGAATQKLMEFEIMKKKGLLADLEKGFLIPKKTRSKLPLRAEKKRSKVPMRTDLLGFIPKKKRSKLASHHNRTNNMKRKRLYSAEHDDQNTNIQIQGVKREKTTAHYLDSLQVSSSLPLGMPSHSQEITNKISSHVGGGDKPLWSFQRKSQLRFSLIKLNVSSRTTMVS